MRARCGSSEGAFGEGAGDFQDMEGGFQGGQRRGSAEQREESLLSSIQTGSQC